jgi:Flp pilus assembly protein TadD
MVAALLLVLLAGCAGTPQTDSLLDGGASGLPRYVEIPDVPFVAQKEHWCGPAAMAMAVAWSGLPVTQEQMAGEVYTPGREGTLTTDMISAARRNGRLAVRVHTLHDLLAELAAGHPVIVFQNLALDVYPMWHYAVAFGYDLDAGTLLLHSGDEARHVEKLGTFEYTWRRGHDWALLVLPPDRLPATASQVEVAEAAAGIERAGRPKEAATAYRTLLRRWPDNGTAWLGLGNIAYGAGDLATAADDYRSATRVAPKMGAAWNNLAVVLAKLGHQADARAAVEQALAVDAPHADTYKATLAEIDAGG